LTDSSYRDSAGGISPFQLFSLAFGTIIGVGWITVLGPFLAQAGSAGIVLAFLAGAMLVALIGLCYGELAGLYPATGGEIIYAFKALGPRYAFIAGWLLVLVYVIVAAFEAISVGWILSILIPGVEGPVLYSAFGHELRLGAVLIGWAGMALFALINLKGASVAAGAQNLLTYALVAVSVVFVAAGLWRGDVANLDPYFVAPVGSHSAFGGFLSVLITTPFWFAGFNVIPQALGETESGFSSRRVGFLILASIIGAGVFYTLVFVSASMTLPRAEFLELDLPAATAFTVAFDSEILGKVVLVAGLLGLLTTWNAVVFSAARVLLALGRGGFVSSRFAGLHPTSRTPAFALGAVTAAGSGLVLLGRGGILPLINTVGFCFSILFLLMAASFLILRFRRPGLARPFLVRYGIPVGVAAALLSASMIILSLAQHWAASTTCLPLEWVLLMVWGLVGIVSWRFGGKNRSRLSASDQEKKLMEPVPAARGGA
jgi:amino acid transporter